LRQRDIPGLMIFGAACLVALVLWVMQSTKPQCRFDEVAVLGINYAWACARKATK
jgi:hypothetical protein